MRQRKIKNIDDKLDVFSDIIIEREKSPKGEWRDVFAAPHNSKLYLEIGCGKGMFINTSAVSDPQGCYIGAEGLRSVIIRAITAADAAEARNIRFYSGYVNDINSMFDNGELNGIFLNFSDPWPKAKHAKRRLTCADRLVQYSYALCSGGFIKFKTDSDDMFEFTLRQIGQIGSKAGFKISEMTRDLEASEFSAGSPKTEYELKFSAQGKTINYIALIRV